LATTSSKKSPAELFQEREKRIADVVSLKVPDRVPLRFSLAYFPAKYCAIPTKAAFYDPAKWKWACKKTLLDFDADCYLPSTGVGSGQAMEILGVRTMKWPGHGLPDNTGHQAIEMEPMKQEEYDEFLADPSDFIMRKFIPRVTDAGAAFAKWPAFRSLTSGNALPMLAARLADPEQIEFLETLVKAGKAAAATQKEMSTFDAEMEALGQTNLSPGGAGAPFDIVSDSLRGMRGAMMDMYKAPDKLIKVCEMYVNQSLERAAAFAKNSKNKRVFMALHRGSDGFMSIDQFKTFYWPTYKKVVMGLIDMGLTPVPFYEGIWNQRLEFLREFPKGKTIAHFAQTDMRKAKEVLGGHTCIMGDVPSSILQVGTVSQVEEYCKKLIDDCGKNGGLIVTHMPIDEADPKLVRAMIEFVKKYGVYS
jgi:uroporphyrinogen-III decarboxylase